MPIHSHKYIKKPLVVLVVNYVLKEYYYIFLLRNLLLYTMLIFLVRNLLLIFRYLTYDCATRADTMSKLQE